MKKEKTNSVKKQGKYYTPEWIVNIARIKTKQLINQNCFEDYTVWDCAAGSGNLLAGMDLHTNFFLSDIDPISVEQIKQRQKEDLKVPLQNIFLFDFLNDDPKNLPTKLKNTDPSKILFFINPPYLSAKEMDISAQFLVKIKQQYKGSKIACFTKPLWSQPKNKKFRQLFNSAPEWAEHLVFHSKEFNTNGHFPILFTIWDTAHDCQVYDIECRIIDKKITGIKTFRIIQDE